MKWSRAASSLSSRSKSLVWLWWVAAVVWRSSTLHSSPSTLLGILHSYSDANETTARRVQTSSSRWTLQTMSRIDLCFTLAIHVNVSSTIATWSLVRLPTSGHRHRPTHACSAGYSLVGIRPSVTRAENTSIYCYVYVLIATACREHFATMNNERCQ